MTDHSADLLTWFDDFCPAGQDDKNASKHLGKSVGSIKKIMKNKGQIFILSAPSGAGKTTLCQSVRKHFPGLLYSISHTTRKPRLGEQEGISYFFISKEKFEEKIAEGEWAEWAEVHGNYYGTSARFIEAAVDAGNDILLDIDVQGTLQILKKYPDSITIFILPPSLGILRERLELRGTDSRKVIAARLRTAQDELQKKDIYRYQIMNDKLPEARTRLLEIIEKHRRDKRPKRE